MCPDVECGGVWASSPSPSSRKLFGFWTYGKDEEVCEYIVTVVSCSLILPSAKTSTFENLCHLYRFPNPAPTPFNTSSDGTRTITKATAYTSNNRNILKGDSGHFSFFSILNFKEVADIVFGYGFGNRFLVKENHFSWKSLKWSIL